MRTIDFVLHLAKALGVGASERAHFDPYAPHMLLLLLHHLYTRPTRSDSHHVREVPRVLVSKTVERVQDTLGDVCATLREVSKKVVRCRIR